MSKPDFYYYNESEWDRLGCGTLPEDRRRPATEQSNQDIYLVYPADDGYDTTKNPFSQH
jgi:hypothetical protein